MIYKFETTDSNGSADNYLEVQQYESALLLTVTNPYDSPDNALEIHLNKSQLYDLIGALHSLQTKMKGDGNNG